MILNKSMRQSIITAAFEKAFKKEFDAWYKKARAIVLKAYNLHTPPEVQALCKRIPANLTITQINVVPYLYSEESGVEVLKFGQPAVHNHPRSIKMHDPMYVPDDNFVVVNSALYAEAESHMKAYRQIDKKRKESVDAIKVLVTTARTTQQLEAQWPEGRKLLKEFGLVVDSQKKDQLPSVVLPALLLTEAFS